MFSYGTFIISTEIDNMTKEQAELYGFILIAAIQLICSIGILVYTIIGLKETRMLGNRQLNDASKDLFEEITKALRIDKMVDWLSNHL